MTKRIFDIFFSIIGLLLLCPLFLVVAALIKSDSPGPVLFRQKRVGFNGKIFRIYKFRTMVNNAEQKGVNFTTPKNDSRITKIGCILRKYKIDEFPQLINVLKGEMSFVGPRPEIPEIVKLYSEEQKKVFSVRPGMTDYASLKFRNEGDIYSTNTSLYQDYVNGIMPLKLELNLKYIKEQSVWLDIKLISKTVAYIVFDICKRDKI